MKQFKSIPLILLFGVANATLYCGLLPLWEGWDEPFHYAYVQSISVQHELPVLHLAQISQEIRKSLLLAPASPVVQRNMPELTTFDQFFALPAADRSARRQRIKRIAPSEMNSTEATQENYQAHHAPLAYAFLAVPDAMLARTQLLTRVLWLRVLCGVLAVLLTGWAALILSRQIKLTDPFRAAALFCTFCSQAFYATAAHIANDWLGVVLAAWLLAGLIHFAEQPSSTRRALYASVLLAMGLLTKSYFLAFVPLAAAVFILRRSSKRSMLLAAATVLLLAGPWYARNIVLYGNFSGMLETASISPVHAFIEGARQAHWPSAIPYMARASLWSGNNFFTTFSRTTLDVLLGFIAAGALLWLWRVRRGMRRSEAILAGGILIFFLALVYMTALGFSFSHGAEAGAKPWYAQVLLAPVLCLVFLGCAEAGRWGRIIAACIVSVWTYLILATYYAKLLPLYAGLTDGRTTLRRLIDWYAASSTQIGANLRTTALLAPEWIYALLALVSVLAIGLCVSIALRVSKFVRVRN